MAYEPTNWQAGDVVTSAKLNKIEQGIAGHNMVEGIVDEENETVTLNKTWQEIWDNNYTSIMVTTKSDDSYKSFAFIKQLEKAVDNDPYFVLVSPLEMGPTVRSSFTCNSPDGYPSYDIRSSGNTDE